MAATSSYLTESAGTISGSQQITDFGFISESYSTAGTDIISGSSQIATEISGAFTSVSSSLHQIY